MGYLEFKNKLVNDIMMNENNINIQKLKLHSMICHIC